MRSSLRAFAAAAVVASTTGLLLASATPATALCQKVEMEWHEVYNGPFGYVRVPVPSHVETIGCVTGA